MNVSVGLSSFPLTSTYVQKQLPANLNLTEIGNGLCEKTSHILQKINDFFTSKISAPTPQPISTEGASSIVRAGGKRIKNEALQNILLFPGSCLELALKDYICTNVDIKADCGFADYLYPNERHPENVAPHLSQMPKGLIVSVGTERCFFDLLSADPKKCEGMIERDINPRVKAYVDFNVLLLRIAVSREEYCALAKKPENDESFKLRLATIREKIKTSNNIPSFLKDYYQKYLEDFASVYYKTPKYWAEGSMDDSSNPFARVNYYKNDDLFARLQQYAKSGRIVSTIGNINDLSPFRAQRIAAIDTSNVYKYSALDLQGYSFDRPIPLIWVVGLVSQFNSLKFTPLNAEERAELDRIYKQLQNATQKEAEGGIWALEYSLPTLPVDGRPPVSCYCRETLESLRDFCAKYLFYVPECGFVLMKGEHIGKIKKASRESVEELTQDPRLAPIVCELVNNLLYLGKTYIDFMDVPGWRDEFEKRMEQTWFGLKNLIAFFREEGILQEFIDRFGKDRIACWKPELRALIAL